MNILERASSLMAPHVCLVCSREGSLLCPGCAYVSLVTLPSRCYSCHKATTQSAVCDKCRRKVKLKRVWVSAEYSGTAKELVAKLKFERAKAAGGVIAQWLDAQLPVLPKDMIITHVPTANSRVRMRGYDQAQLIAKSLAGKRELVYHDVLRRQGSSRQVGAGRKERIAHLENAYKAADPAKIKDKHILLVDDVITTGATIESAAKTLHLSGAKTVEAVIFAH